MPSIGPMHDFYRACAYFGGCPRSELQPPHTAARSSWLFTDILTNGGAARFTAEAQGAGQLPAGPDPMNFH